MASMMMDLPAPVSPVRIFSPGLERQFVDNGEITDAKLVQHGAILSPVAQMVE
jgi:hypothetical protein